MASISDLSFRHRLFLKAYRFRKLEPVPWKPLKRPLEDCRVALVTTAAFYLPGMEPFDEGHRGGDPSYRVLPILRDGGSVSSALSDILLGHRSDAFDPRGVEEDSNLALPASRFLELEREGAIGRLHPEALSFMGSITAPGRLVKETAPEAGEKLRQAGVDAAFFCPV